MGQAAYEMLSLGMRYVFTLLIALFFVRAALMLLRERRDRNRLLRRLPDAGLVGEMVTLADGRGYPLAREGVLGSGRGCDVRLPGLKRRELEFAFQSGRGLLLRPLRGRVRALLDGEALTRDNNAALHGTILEIRGMALRFRLFAGLKVPERKPRQQPELLESDQPFTALPHPQNAWDVTWQYAPTPNGLQGAGWDAGWPGGDKPWAVSPPPAPPVPQEYSPQNAPVPDDYEEIAQFNQHDGEDEQQPDYPNSDESLPDDPMYPADCYHNEGEAAGESSPGDETDVSGESLTSLNEQAEDEKPNFASFRPDGPDSGPDPAAQADISITNRPRRRRAGRGA